jgi:cyclophilin family peptidyl-prolyl cis-trans isomerase
MKKYYFFLLIAVLLSACSKSIYNPKSPGYSPIVEIETEFGNMEIVLYSETPKHRDNFVKLVKEGFYDSLLFHRVINNFMIQGGDPQSKNAKPGIMLGNGGPGYTVPAEFVDTLLHYKGVLSAARMGDQVNPEKESSGSQFYIVQGQKVSTAIMNQMQSRNGNKYTEEQQKKYAEIGGTPHLDGSYTVFGEVIKGLEVLDKIAVVQCNRANRPLKDIIMKIIMKKG